MVNCSSYSPHLQDVKINSTIKRTTALKKRHGMTYWGMVTLSQAGYTGLLCHSLCTLEHDFMIKRTVLLQSKMLTQIIIKIIKAMEICFDFGTRYLFFLLFINGKSHILSSVSVSLLYLKWQKPNWEDDLSLLKWT